jgi:hypothetical protein
MCVLSKTPVYEVVSMLACINFLQCSRVFFSIFLNSNLNFTPQQPISTCRLAINTEFLLLFYKSNFSRIVELLKENVKVFRKVCQSGLGV